jgi:hypothetical protein
MKMVSGNQNEIRDVDAIISLCIYKLMRYSYIGEKPLILASIAI